MRKTRYMIAVAAVLVLSGCLNGTRAPIATTYYTLEYSPPGPVSPAPAESILRLERLESLLDPAGRDMLYRSGPFIRDTYRYHRWHAPPTDMVQGLLLRDIRSAGLFRAVLSPGESGEAQYILTGQVEEFLQREDQGNHMAMLAISMTLVDVSGTAGASKVILQKTYRLAEPIDVPQPLDFARGMSAAMNRFSRALLSDMAGALNGRP